MDIKKYITDLINNPSGFAENYNVGLVLHTNGNLKRAIKFFRRAARIDPTSPHPLNDLGTVYNDLGKPNIALKYFKKALKLNPRFSSATYNIGYTLAQYKNKSKLAGSYFRKAFKQNPKDSKALSLYYQSIRGSGNFKLKGRLAKKLDRLTLNELQKEEEVGEYPFLNLTRKQEEKQNLQIANNWAKRLTLTSPKPAFLKKQAVTLKSLRIAYISDNLKDFPTGHNLAGVIANHSQKVNVSIYSWGKKDNSLYAQTIQKRADNYTNISNMSDKEAAKKITNDKIDILIDLKGWTKDNKMGVLAFKPAPIIVNYLGYPGTTGSIFHDYLIADKIVIPETSQKYFSEQIVYLPHCYRPADTTTPIKTNKHNPIRSRSEFIFASTNSVYKIDRQIFNCWLNILNTIPDSQLWILTESSKAKKYLQKHPRIKLLDFTDKRSHLARLSGVDLCLDTQVISGHTTITDAARMGVPTLCFRGKHFASRVSASVNNELGLDNLIATNITNYKKIAIKYAKNQTFRNQILSNLIINNQSSIIFNPKAFANSLEKVYFSIVENHE